MRVILLVAIATLAFVFAPPAEADTFLSYSVSAGDYGPNDIGGVGVRVQDLFNYTTSAIVVSLSDSFSGDFEDLDAAHVLADGKILLSSRTTIFDFASNDLDFSHGDLVLYDPVADTASILLTGSSIFGPGGGNIDAVFKFESGLNDGRYVLSTSLGSMIGGGSYDARDLILYDPGTDTSSLYLDGDVIGGTLNGRNINGVHVLDNGNIVITTFSPGGVVDGLSPYKNFIEYNPSTGDATLYLDGDIFDSIGPRVFDAISITSSSAGGTGSQNQGPEPTTFVLAGIALLAALSLRHRL